MVSGLGVDVVDVERIERIMGRWGDRFLKRIFKEEEREGLSAPEHIAGRVAAKEAVMKLLRTGLSKGLTWKEIVILGRGPLTVRLEGRAKQVAKTVGVENILLSISHERNIAMAVAIGLSGSFLGVMI